MIRQIVGPRTFDVLVLKAANAVELCFIHPIEQGLKFGLGLAGVADDKGGSQGDVGTFSAPSGDLIQGTGGSGRAGHAAQNVWMGVLERNIQIGQHAVCRVRHQRDQIAHMRVRVDVMQPNPSAKAAQLAGQVSDVTADLAVLPRVQIVLAI